MKKKFTSKPVDDAIEFFKTFFGKNTTPKPIEELNTYKNIKFQPLPTIKLKTPQNNDKVKCVIYYNGTFAPVHPGHLDAMEAAKKGLEENGVKKN